VSLIVAQKKAYQKKVSHHGSFLHAHCITSGSF
jgi:hypothetical protein